MDSHANIRKGPASSLDAIAKLADRADAVGTNARANMEKAIRGAADGAGQSQLADLVEALVIQFDRMGSDLRAINA